MATITAVNRTFLYGGRTLPDPDPRMNTEEVKQFYAAIHPELLNASVEGGEFDGETQTWRFERSVGTKG
jgi:PRTRC genetic system protein C